jgi:S-adenosylmethionine:tRNA ribosyltransferase-isomerase
MFNLNNTKVFPHVYTEKKNRSKNRSFFRELNEQRLWDVLVDPARKIRIGNKLYLDDDSLVAEVIDNTTLKNIAFPLRWFYEEFRKIDRTWRNPIPKYISRDVTQKMSATKRFMLKRRSCAATAGFTSLNIY